MMQIVENSDEPDISAEEIKIALKKIKHGMAPGEDKM